MDEEAGGAMSYIQTADYLGSRFGLFWQSAVVYKWDGVEPVK